MTRLLPFFLLFFSLSLATEFRALVRTDGRVWYAVLVSISLSQEERVEQLRMPPELLRESSTELSFREAMYVRNRLEEILDDDREEYDETP